MAKAPAFQVGDGVRISRFAQKQLIKIMDEYSKQSSNEGKKKKNSDTVPNDSDVSEPNRIRCGFRNGIEVNRFILDYHRYFLPIVSIILWSIFLLG